ncbi:DUF6261 family protein [Saccharicrinis aurantiacus]|uniref:DUF6261 family protein n=1 Tax=Saccharicrinis aurantiacus TaxID=1849719 RepID=UPI00094FFA3C|nr:DUF6261 family protein [Saccharicrinis aurantiacus]
MEKIQKIRTDIRVAELAGLGQICLGEFSAELIESDANLANIVSKASPIVDAIVDAMNKDEVSLSLQDKDSGRDSTYKSIVYLVRGYLHHPDANVAAAAQKVDAIIKKYGFELIEVGYVPQSALIKSFLADMNAAELKAAIDILVGVGALLITLDTQEMEFLAFQKENATQLNAKLESANASELKQELIKLLNGKLIVYLRGMQAIQLANYKVPCANIAKYINDANEVVRQRRLSKVA